MIQIAAAWVSAHLPELVTLAAVAANWARMETRTQYLSDEVRRIRDRLEHMT